MVKSFSAGKVLFGDGGLVLVAGPCVLEDRETALSIAREVSGICGRLGIPYVFKASFDKANRTSIHSFRGPGLEKGLQWLAEVKESVGCPVLTDIHLPARPKGRPRWWILSRYRPSSAGRPTSLSPPRPRAGR